jgi:hypothetical protein
MRLLRLAPATIPEIFHRAADIAGLAHREMLGLWENLA